MAPGGQRVLVGPIEDTYYRHVRWPYQTGQDPNSLISPAMAHLDPDVYGPQICRF